MSPRLGTDTVIKCAFDKLDSLFHETELHSNGKCDPENKEEQRSNEEIISDIKVGKVSKILIRFRCLENCMFDESS